MHSIHLYKSLPFSDYSLKKSLGKHTWKKKFFLISSLNVNFGHFVLDKNVLEFQFFRNKKCDTNSVLIFLFHNISVCIQICIIFISRIVIILFLLLTTHKFNWWMNHEHAVFILFYHSIPQYILYTREMTVLTVFGTVETHTHTLRSSLKRFTGEKVDNRWQLDQFYVLAEGTVFCINISECYHELFT